MDSFELNKILGAILGTLLFVMGIGFLAEAIYSPIKGATPGYDLPAPEETAGGDEGGTATAATVSIGTLLASADPAAGEAAAKKCSSCHDFTEGGPNKTGPNLYDVVERKIAGHPGFAYSAALTAHASETWSYEKLNDWLISPKAFANGTKMTYAGDKDDKDRANIIAYLATLSKSPKPFPASEDLQGTAPAGQSDGTVSSAASGQAVTSPSTSDTNGTTGQGGSGTNTEIPAGASSQPPQNVNASSEAISSAVSSAREVSASNASEPAPTSSASAAAPATSSEASAAPGAAASSSASAPVTPPSSSAASSSVAPASASSAAPSSSAVAPASSSVAPASAAPAPTASPASSAAPAATSEAPMSSAVSSAAP